ncbi:MAG: sialidase family protein [Chlorobiota bacterium]
MCRRRSNPWVVAILATATLWGQQDARQLPLYLQAGMETQSIRWGAIRRVNLQDYRPEDFIKPHEGPHLLHGPTRIPLVNISPYPLDQSETWITLHPQNPRLLLAGANDSRYNYGGNYRMVSYRSTDGGRTWSAALTPQNFFVPTNTGAAIADPGLCFDSDGNAYYSHIMVQLLNDEPSGTNGVFVALSTNAGQSWTELSPVTLNQGQNVPFDDKCLMVVDTISTSPYRNSIYVAWRRFGGTPGIYVARSTDRGQSWSVPVLLPGSGGDTQAPILAVGPQGQVYVAWRQRLGNRENALFQISTDGGRTWRSAPVLAQSVVVPGTINSASGRQVLPDKQNIRVSSYPAIAVDLSTGPRRGWIYLAQAGRDDLGRTGIYLTYSTNGGTIWALPQRIDNNALNNDVFFPAICVDPVTGMIAVLYYSSQHDPQNKGVDAYLAISRDAQSWRHVRLTPWTFYIDGPEDVSFQGPGNYYWGDYTGITAYGGRIYPCFWMPNAPRGSFSTLDAYVALVSSAPRPPDSLRATFPAAGSVRLRWRDPTENLLGEPLGDFVIRVFRGSTLVATIPKGQQEYTESGLPDGDPFSYTLVAVAPDSLESEPITISGFVGGAREPLPPTDILARPHEDGVFLSWRNPAYHIDSSDFYDFARLYIYDIATGAPIDSLEPPRVQAGAPTSHVVRLPAGRFYQLFLRAAGLRSGRLTLSQPSDTVLAYAGAPLRQFYATFDDSATTPAMFTNGAWGLTTRAAVSPPNSLTDSPVGNYPHRSNTWVVLAPVLVSAATPTLSYETIALVEVGDTAVTDVSPDFGRTWYVVQAIDIRRSPGFRDSVGNSQWVSEHRDLRRFIGDTLYIRFRLRSNPLRNNDGWYIDNVRLDAAEPDAITEPITATPSALLFPQPAAEEVWIELPTSTPPKPARLVQAVDVLGQVYWLPAEPVVADAGIVRLRCDVRHLPTGLYLLRLWDGLTAPLLIAR